MTLRVQRTRDRVLMPGHLSARGRVTGGGGAAVPWWLSGGIVAANCLAAYTPKGAASQAASYDNNAAPGNGLADGTYDATVGADIAGWDTSIGWQFDGGTGRLNSGLTAAGAGTWSAIVRVTTSGSGGSGAGRAFATTAFSITPNRGTEVQYYNGYYGNFSPAVTTTTVLGFTGYFGYRNGALDGELTSTEGANPAGVIYIGNRSTGTTGLNGTIAALAFYNTSISAAQMLAVATTMAAL